MKSKESIMFRACLIIIVLHLGLLFHGCAVLESPDGRTNEKRERSEMAKDEMRDEIERLSIETANLRKEMNNIRAERDLLKRQINILKEEKKSITSRSKPGMARMRQQNQALTEQMNKLREENQRIYNENQLLVKKLASLQPQEGPPSTKSKRSRKEMRKLRIKVLSGDGDINSAKETAKKLRNMGYSTRLIDYAPRSNFFQNTVYFAPKFKDEAKHIAPKLSTVTIFKPLNWPSKFDIIVVTGKNP